MKKRLIFGFLVLSLMTVAGHAAFLEVPMKGSGNGNITAPPTPGPNGIEISAAGSGVATHLGKFTREESLVLNPATGTFTGTIVFIAADGSELNCNVAGGFTGVNTAAGTYTFTGGTGRFENATGSAFFSVVQSDPVNFTFEFVGTIDIN